MTLPAIAEIRGDAFVNTEILAEIEQCGLNDIAASSDKSHHHELQSGQRARGRAYNHIKILPSGKRGKGGAFDHQFLSSGPT